jgi:hypothetical protein
MKNVIVCVIAVFTTSMLGLRAHAQEVVLGRQVPAGNRVSMDRIDHSSWNSLLGKYVNDKGQVNYRGLKASSNDSLLLDQYLATLSTASTSAPASRESQLSYWINAYNAVTVKGILREYPTKSIRDHTSKFGGYNLWKHLLLAVDGTQISLDSIEHKVLRKMNEPRIHFAIVCASHSCPRLLNQAYTAPQLADQLTVNTKNFFGNPENFQYDPARRKFKLSSIMKWFGADFGADQAARLKTIAPYLPTRESYQAALDNSVRVSYLDYSWALNEQPPVAEQGSGMKNQGSGMKGQGSGRR